MKVLHISSVQSGGAGWCAIRINNALVKAGVDSRMLFAEGLELPFGVKGDIAKPDKTVFKRFPILAKAKNFLQRLGVWPLMDADALNMKLERVNRGHYYLHQPLSNYKNIAHHPLVEWADIIHLHWVCDFVDYPTFFKEVKKPIVWTLHDKYPASGVQHSFWDMTPFPENLKKIDNWCKNIKRKAVLETQCLNIVAISEAMVGICNNSDVLKGFPVTLIHNGVDTDVFHPYDKLSVRKELGLRDDACIFLFSAYYIHDHLKNLNSVIQALEKVDIPNKTLICMGNSNRPMIDTTFSVLMTGCMRDEEKMAKLYSAADYFIMASMEETFSQTPLEAMACGTPVISTPVSGAADLIRPFNGVVCDGYDAGALLAGIQQAIEVSYECAVIHIYIKENFQYNKIAEQYIQLYQSINESSRHPESHGRSL